MKVNKNDPIEPNIPLEHYNDGTIKRKSKGVPIRLMLAAQILSGMNVSGNVDGATRTALMAADKLIELHNETFEDKVIDPLLPG